MLRNFYNSFIGDSNSESNQMTDEELSFEIKSNEIQISKAAYKRRTTTTTRFWRPTRTTTNRFPFFTSLKPFYTTRQFFTTRPVVNPNQASFLYLMQLLFGRNFNN